MQSLTGLSCLRTQIAAQEKRNVDLAASNTTLKKVNAELGDSNKELSLKVVELKSKYEELDDNYAELIKENAKLVGQADVVKEELTKEKAENAVIKVELESSLKKMQFIAVDAILHSKAKLMGEFKRAEHATWDLD